MRHADVHKLGRNQSCGRRPRRPVARSSLTVKKRDADVPRKPGELPHLLWPQSARVSGIWLEPALTNVTTT